MSPGQADSPGTVSLLTHTRADQTSEAVRQAVRAAAKAGVRLVASVAEVEKHGDAATGVEGVEDPETAADLCLVLGGDGTILQALRAHARSGVPVFAINFGTIGFLAAAERDEAGEALARVFGGDFEVIALPGLEIETEVGVPFGLNDVSFTRKPHGRVAELSYRLGGKEVGHVRCDGLVAATPAGSTGYNLANQGPILAWGVEGYVVSFIAPHTLTARPLVVAPDDTLEVRNAEGREPVDVSLDGEPVSELPSGESLAVRFRDDVGALAQFPGANFYRRMREKFGHLAG